MAIPILERLGLRGRGSRGQENNHPTVEKDVAMATQTIEEAPATSAGEGRPWIEGSELRDTKAPAGPIEANGPSGSSRRNWSTRPTGASSR